MELRRERDVAYPEQMEADAGSTEGGRLGARVILRLDRAIGEVEPRTGAQSEARVAGRGEQIGGGGGNDIRRGVDLEGSSAKLDARLSGQPLVVDGQVPVLGGDGAHSPSKGHAAVDLIHA